MVSFFGAVVVALSGAAATTAQPLPQSDEFQINAYTPEGQASPSIAAESDGDFVVVWEQQAAGPAVEIYGRRFDSLGNALGLDFHVNEYTTANQGRPWVVRNPSGPFVVVWNSVGQDGSTYGIFGRRFDATGTPLASEFQVNTVTEDMQRFPRAGMASDGSFVVVWESNEQDGGAFGIFGRRFDAMGNALAAEFQVNDFALNDQRIPAVVVKADKGFVVAWLSEQDGNGYGVFARRFDSSGNATGGEFQLSTYTSGSQNNVAIALDSSGGFVASWSSPQDGSETGVFARRFDAAGQPISGELQVNVHTPDSQNQPSVIQTGGGSFVVVWQSELQDGDFYGVFARAFNAHAQPRGGEIQINTFHTNTQTTPRVAATGQRFVVTWASGTQDGQFLGIFARRYLMTLTLDVDGDGVVLPLTDTLLILRYTFGFRGDTLTSDAVGDNCSRCDSTSIVEYLDGI